MADMIQNPLQILESSKQEREALLAELETYKEMILKCVQDVENEAIIGSNEKKRYDILVSLYGKLINIVDKKINVTTNARELTFAMNEIKRELDEMKAVLVIDGDGRRKKSLLIEMEQEDE